MTRSLHLRHHGGERRLNPRELKSNLVYGMRVALVDQAASHCCSVSLVGMGTPSLKTIPASS
ncbi:MAG: hypothetical protein J0M01_15250, partial [Dechloromonas sp.]|nr:hypothetical protein [Dechloromonas sp.]